MSEIDMAQFVKERDEALLSLDRDKVLAYYRKYGNAGTADWMSRMDEEEFLLMVHKARTGLNSLPKDAIKASLEWLESRGYRPYPAE